jgi:hypothetical protein
MSTQVTHNPRTRATPDRTVNYQPLIAEVMSQFCTKYNNSAITKSNFRHVAIAKQQERRGVWLGHRS